MKKMCKYISWLLIIILFLIVTEYKGHMFSKSEIDKTLFINVFGIDYAKDNPDIFRITSSSTVEKSRSSGESSSSGKKGAISMSTEGRTFFEAIRKLNTTSIKKVFLGHMEHILIGEKAAQTGILKYLDLLERDHEIRLNSLVYIVRGDTAEQVLNRTNTSEYYLADRLNSLIDERGGLSISGKVELANLIGTFDNKNISSAIPCISLVKATTSGDEGEKNMDIKLDGYAIFCDDKLTGYILDNDARGLNWIRGEVRSGIIVVKDNYGEIVSLEITGSKVDIDPVIDGDRLAFYVNIKMTSNLGETLGRNDIFNEKSFSFMESQQEAIIKSEIEKTIAYAQQNNTDFLLASEAIAHKYPAKWEKIKNSWGNLFPDIKFYVNVKSYINRTYNIERPTGGDNQ